MARIRTIKPKHVEDKELVNISLQAHLLWILMWPFSDDEGIIENDPLLIKSQVFPRRTDVRVSDVSQWLDQLVKARFIIPFDHDGIGYYIHRTFKTHQKIDKPQPSKIPAEVIRGIVAEPSTIVLASRVKESKVVEGSGGVDTSLCYNAESVVLENQIEFEKICCAAPKNLTADNIKEVLQKYHLYLDEKGRYPMTKQQIHSGFKRWLINEKNFNNAGTQANRKKFPGSNGTTTSGSVESLLSGIEP